MVENRLGFDENSLVQEGRRQKAEGRRQKAPREGSLYSKLFNLFKLVDYFRHAVLVWP